MTQRQFCRWILLQNLTTYQANLASILYAWNGYESANRFINHLTSQRKESIMLSPMVQEVISAPPNTFYCDHDPNCVDSAKLPYDVADMLMKDRSLIMIVGKHEPPKGSKVVTKGKGWKVLRIDTKPNV